MGGGETERGLTLPRLVTSWTEFDRWFGGFLDLPTLNRNNRFLPYAVRGFFENGGQRVQEPQSEKCRKHGAGRRRPPYETSPALRIPGDVPFTVRVSIDNTHPVVDFCWQKIVHSFGDGRASGLNRVADLFHARVPILTKLP